MLEILPEISVIFISLALLGFLLKDAYNWELFRKPPTMYRNYIPSLFHYVSIGIFVLSIVIIFIVISLVAPNQNNIFSNFLNFIFKIIEAGESSNIFPTGFTLSVKNYLALAFFPAFIYFGMIAVTIAIGRFFRSTNNQWINVELIDGWLNSPKIISDDDDFFYFEQDKNPGTWIAVRKDNIRKMTIQQHPSRFGEHFRSYIKKLSCLYNQKQYWELVSSITLDIFPYLPLALLVIILLFLPH